MNNNHECCGKCKNQKDTTRRLIALTGKDQYMLEYIQNYLTGLINVFKVKKVTSNDLTTDEFLSKIIKGDIIEASCDDNYIITGTSKSSLEPGFLYVGIYTPHQLSNLLECKDKDLQIFPFEVATNGKQLMNNIIDKTQGNVYEACKEYIKIVEHYDADEYLNGVNCYWKMYETNSALFTDMQNNNLQKDIKLFNDANNLITNLDNFI